MVNILRLSILSSKIGNNSFIYMDEIQWIALEAIGTILTSLIALLALIISLRLVIKQWLNRPILKVKVRKGGLLLMYPNKNESEIIHEISLEIKNSGKIIANNVVIKYESITQKLIDRLSEREKKYIKDKDEWDDIKNKMLESCRPELHHKLIKTVGNIPGKDYIIVPLFVVLKNMKRIKLSVDNISPDEYYNEILAYNTLFKIKIYSQNHPIFYKKFRYIHNTDPRKIKIEDIS